MSEPMRCTCGGAANAPHVHDPAVTGYARRYALTSDLISEGDSLVYVGFTVEPVTPWAWRIIRRLTFWARTHRPPPRRHAPDHES